MIETPSDSSDQAPGLALEWGDPSTLPVEEVKELFVVLSKALRAHQLYDENNPVYQKFVSQFRGALQGVWNDMDRLPINVEEDALTWLSEEVYRSSSRTDSLAFLLYKDGVREFTLHKGLEEHELVDLLEVLNRARDLRPEGDDLLTVLWEKDLKYFTYSYVDLLAEGLDYPSPGEGFPGGFQQILDEEIPAGREAGGEKEPAATGPVSADDFNPTLYSLDPLEMERIQAEIHTEMTRDLRGEVLAALFDRVEEPRFPERQQEILGIFETLLPTLLGRGAVQAAGSIVEEVVRLLGSEAALRSEQRAVAEAVLEDVSGADTLKELIQALEDGSISPEPEELAALLRHLRAGALEPLLRGAEETEDRKVQTVIQDAVRSIARKYGRALVQCLESDDPVVVAGACTLVGKMGLSDAAGAVTSLLSHESPRVRLAAVDAATQLRTATAVSGLQEALRDREREVRIAAAKALGGLRHRPAAQIFRAVLEGKAIRQADISEQIAFFESYGLIRDPSGVPFLDGLLNGRGFLGRKEIGEIRACAALALGKFGTPEARAALEKAAFEQDPVVRSAVNRALREEGVS